MKKWVMLLIFISLSSPTTVLAQEPTPTPVTPYVFEPSPGVEGTPAPPPVGIDTLLASTDTINSIGSYAVTLWVMLDNFAGGGVLAILVIFLAGIWVIRHVARFVFNKSVGGQTAIEASPAIDAIESTEYGKQWSEFGRELARKKRF